MHNLAHEPPGLPKLAVLVVGYALVAASSSLFFDFSSDFCLWFANVIAVAFLLRNPSVSVAGGSAAVLAGGLLANLALNGDLRLVALFAACNALGVGLGVWMARRLTDWQASRPLTMPNYVQILLLAGYAAPAVAGTIFSVVAAGLLAWPFATTLWTWWSGDALGFSLMLPVLLLASRKTLGSLLVPRQAAKVAFLIAACILVSFVALAMAKHPFLLPAVLLIVTAVLTRPFETAVACLTSGVALFYLVARGEGMVLEGTADHQFAVAFMAILPFLGSLILQQSRRDQRMMAESGQFFRRAMEDSAIGVSVVALDGSIIEANAALAQMLGRSRGELVKLRFSDIAYPDDLEIGNNVVRQAREHQRANYEFEKRYTRGDGSPVWARVSGSVIFDEKTGEPLYMVSQIIDIDARKRAQAAVEEAETRWDFALASAGQGVWDVDARKGGVSYSPTWAHMLGYEPGELDGEPDHWLSLIHPDDRERVEKADRDHREGRTGMFEAEFRMRRKDGSWIWILDRGKIVQRDEHGKVVRAIGTMTDITQRKEAEEDLARTVGLLANEKERLRVTLASIGDAVICTDAQDRITFINPAAEALTRIEQASAVARPLRDAYVAVDEDTGVMLDLARKSEAEAAGRGDVRAVLVRRDGSRCSIREVVTPIRSADGKAAGHVIVFQDFTDARALQRQLTYAATHDALTGLPNRASFLETMVAAAAEPAAPNREHFFGFIDLDGFKPVNDTSGHAAGDALLRCVADTLRAATEADDHVARLGGDEFAVIFRGCTVEEALRRGRLIAAAVGAIDFAWEGRNHAIGASVGVAPILNDPDAIDDVIAAADDACYAAKRAGGGRVSAATVADRQDAVAAGRAIA